MKNQLIIRKLGATSAKEIEVATGDVVSVSPGDDIRVVNAEGEAAQAVREPRGKDLLVTFRDLTEILLEGFYADEEVEGEEKQTEEITIQVLQPTTDQGTDAPPVQSDAGEGISNLAGAARFSLMRYSNVATSLSGGATTVTNNSSSVSLGGGGGGEGDGCTPCCDPCDDDGSSSGATEAASAATAAASAAQSAADAAGLAAAAAASANSAALSNSNSGSSAQFGSSNAGFNGNNWSNISGNFNQTNNGAQGQPSGGVDPRFESPAPGVAPLYNTPPRIDDKTLDVTEGQAQIITRDDLSSSDSWATTDNLTYAVSQVVGGQFELVSNPGSAVTTFTQQAVDSGQIRFVDDGDEAKPTFSVSVSDGVNTTTEAGIINFTPVNDAPQIVQSTIASVEGERVPVTSAMLGSDDPDNVDSELTYTVDTVDSGQFEFNGAPGVAVVSFGQDDVNAGRIVFVHDGSEEAPNFSITVNDGELTDSVVGTIEHTLVNQGPTIVVNKLVIAEGETKEFTSEDLNSSDPDTAPEDLVYSITDVVGGTFEVRGPSGEFESTTSFSQADVNSGDIRFVHDGSETAPSYAATVTDGDLSDSSSVVVEFAPVNEKPVIEQNSVSLKEGETIVLTNEMIGSTDVDDSDSELSYTVDQIEGSQFEFQSDPGGRITSFTQADVDKGRVVLVHDGGETTPSYSLTVMDPEGLEDTGEGVISFVADNDAPEMVAKPFPVKEGEAVTVGNDFLQSSDEEDQSPSDLTISVSGVEGGMFVVGDGEVTEFTQEQVNNGEVSFVQDGTDTAPRFTVKVTDSEGLESDPQEVATEFVANNDKPVIDKNTLELHENDPTILSEDSVSVSDEENVDPSDVHIDVDCAVGGQFEYVGKSGVSIDSFTQQDINDGAVQWVPDGSGTEPVIHLIGSDGETVTDSSTTEVTFTGVNDAPELSTADSEIDEGGTKVLTVAEIDAIDEEDGREVTLAASGVTGGKLVRISGEEQVELAEGESFTAQDIIDKKIAFVHDGGESDKASFNLVATDTEGLVSEPQSVNFGVKGVNEAPVIERNSVSLKEGETIVLTNEMIGSTDVDDSDSELSYTVDQIEGSQFEFQSDPGERITSFTQADVNKGRVVLVHDGGETTPSYSLTVMDPEGLEDTSEGVISFVADNDAPEMVAKPFPVKEGEAVTVGNDFLQSSDEEDQSPSDLTISVSGVEGGMFVVGDGEVTEFTQEQVNNGEVSFVQDGTDTAPRFTVKVTDSEGLESDPQEVAPEFVANNDKPVIDKNTLELHENDPTILTEDSVSVSDEENADPSDVHIDVDCAVGGQFEYVGKSGVSIDSFTQQDINDGAVQWVPDGSGTEPVIHLIGSDGETVTDSSTIEVTFTGVNDAPELSTADSEIDEGGTKVLTVAEINAIDEEDGREVTLAASGVTGGKLVRISGEEQVELAEGESFTAQDIIDKKIAFVHDGGESDKASFGVVATDKDGLSGEKQAVNFDVEAVNDGPALELKPLAISEGGTAEITAEVIKVTDPDTAPGNLAITVDQVEGGQFEFASLPGEPVREFTQQDINSGGVIFRADGGEKAPTITLTASDGKESAQASITEDQANEAFVRVNDAPEIAKLNFSINEGETKAFGAEDLTLTDAETKDANLLTLSAQSVKGGQFLRAGASEKEGDVALKEGDTFTKNEFDTGKIKFAHDGKEAAPSFELVARDPEGKASVARAATIAFALTNDAPVLEAADLTLKSGESLQLTSEILRFSDEETPQAELQLQVAELKGGRFVKAEAGFEKAAAEASKAEDTATVAEKLAVDLRSASDLKAAEVVKAKSSASSSVKGGGRTPEEQAALDEAVAKAEGEAKTADTEATAAETDATALRSTADGLAKDAGDLNQEVTGFNMAEVDAGSISFEHDGVTAVPSLSIKAIDAEGLSSEFASVSVTLEAEATKGGSTEISKEPVTTEAELGNVLENVATSKTVTTETKSVQKLDLSAQDLVSEEPTIEVATTSGEKLSIEPAPAVAKNTVAPTETAESPLPPVEEEVAVANSLAI